MASFDDPGIYTMALADDIQELAQRTQAALVDSHDYFTYSKRVWHFLQQIVVDEDRQFTFRNLVTGTSANEQLLTGRAQLYVANYLIPFTFQHFVSLFEDFFFDLLRSWLVAYPASLSKKEVQMEDVLKAPDKSAIVLTVVEKELNDLKYKRLADWFEYLKERTNVDFSNAAGIQELAEIKASRDILIHNNSIVNATYVSKAGGRARYKEGDELQIPEPYHRASWETINKLVRDVSAGLIEKLR